MHDPTKVDPSSVSVPNIPIVDFARWNSSSSLEHNRLIAAELISACKSIGFAYITNHQIPPARVEEAFSWSKKLFDLTLEEKKLAPHPAGSAVHRGYSWPGLEKVTNLKGDEEDAGLAREELREVADVKESYEIGSDSYAEQPNVWLPEDVLPGFRAFMTDFYWECNETAKTLLQALAMGIGLEDENYFLSSHTGHHNQLRLLHYLPVPSTDYLGDTETRSRLSAHTDWASITMVFQDDCGGLQIENPHKPGDFIDAPPLKDAIVMNIGDLMQRWTNGAPLSLLSLLLPIPSQPLNPRSQKPDTLKSSLHRVTPPTSKTSTTTSKMIPARYSIPYFVGPTLDTVVTCLPECIDGTTPAKHKPILWQEYMLMRASMNYED